MPRPGQVLGLVGTNGIGKSTALQILAGKIKPNFGRYNVNKASLLVHRKCLLYHITVTCNATSCAESS